MTTPNMPFLLRPFCNIRKEPEIYRLLEGCDSSGRSLLTDVMRLRLLAHAHLTSAILGYLILVARGKHFGDTLLVLSIGSVSFAICDVFCGAYADRRGKARAIGIGLKLMLLTSLLYGIASFCAWTDGYQAVGVWLFTVAQVLVGAPLAFINGADTMLTREVFKRVTAVAPRERDGTPMTASDFDSYCGSLKYAGIAIASGLGVLILGLSAYYFGSDALGNAAFGICIATAVIQGVAIPITVRLRRKEDSWRSEEFQGHGDALLSDLKHAADGLYKDKSLRAWVVLAIGISGFLLYTKYHFELSAMNDLLGRASANPAYAIGLAIAVAGLQLASSKGGLAFRHFDRGIGGRSREASRYVFLRSVGKSIQQAVVGSIDDTDAFRIVGALLVVAAIIMMYLADYGCSALGFEESSYLVGLVSLALYAVTCFVRGFGLQLVRSVVSKVAENEYPSLKTSLLSLATAGGGIVHVSCSALFVVLTLGGGNVSRAGVATSVVAMMSLLVLGVFASSLAKNGEKVRPILDRSATRLFVVQGAFYVCLVLSNVLGVKLVEVGWVEFNAGALAFAITYMLSDALSEVFGAGLARRLWKAGVASYPVALVLVMIASAMPGDDLHVGKISMEGLFLGSFASYAVSQRLDIWAFSKLRRSMGQRMLWLRNVLSSLLSQGVDTLIFVLIAFFPVWGDEPSELLRLVLGQMVAKWVFTALGVPLVYAVVAWLRSGAHQEEDPAGAI